MVCQVLKRIDRGRRAIEVILGLLFVVTLSSDGAFAQAAPSSGSFAALLRVMSSNVRFGTAKDGPDAWDSRHERLRACWAEEKADLVGTQEMLPFQAEFLQQAFPDYVYVGRSRDLDNDQGEQCGIFYRRARFVELERGHFWLSETPDLPGSKGWDANLPRMVTWVKLYDREAAQPFVFVNTHFDHQGETARVRSAELLHRRLAPWLANDRVILTGDFNCGENSPPYTALLSDFTSAPALRDSYRVVHPEATGDEGTFNGFQGHRNGPRIDWILVTHEWHIEDAAIVRTDFAGRYPSDHFPVTATLRWGRP